MLKKINILIEIAIKEVVGVLIMINLELPTVLTQLLLKVDL